ncbi:hypothetical protein R3P38DRAFT_2787932 [Favolaschia claudopus]|uniref:Uncharacterized protein n=1 Tax=Favolaschia claudopus TaxID=2862362 RepID=A0AAW0AK90_9AGAR
MLVSPRMAQQDRIEAFECRYTARDRIELSQGTQAPNTPIKAIRNPARQHHSRDVKVGDNPTAQMLSFGKEIEGHAIQQGSARVNNGMQQSVGELATQTSPLS